MSSTTRAFEATRLPGNPIVHSELDASLGTNINGPSLIKVPDWIASPLGKYYLYFAHHHGRHIRMAYADSLSGPWRIFQGGTLQLRDTPAASWSYRAHIASPDVHVDDETRSIVMFYHGGYRLLRPRQATYVATSRDGLKFVSQRARLGMPYWRRFHWNGHYYAITMSGQLYRATNPLSGYRPGPALTLPGARHAAVWIEDGRLHLFFSRIGDAPERILACHVDLSDDWMTWHPSKEHTLLFPREIYEGVRLTVCPSARGAVYERARQLRDPYVFMDERQLYMLYATAGEAGIAIAKLDPAARAATIEANNVLERKHASS
ncbi:glycoside hydrolase family protein [Dyella flagellata]|uniref:Glycosyl hydrolases family 43 n=1 Tax=Dyella flagellata TaxID=1867833 RepID=A0ABQ5XBC4_9GAMM|nr:hypothetical protein [Dyella flagellata]GLQ87928.1 hypothetical protein GCM10007898_14960 [Dyella flagellata]